MKSQRYFFVAKSTGKGKYLILMIAYQNTVMNTTILNFCICFVFRDTHF